MAVLIEEAKVGEAPDKVAAPRSIEQESPARYSGAADMLTSKMPNLVKGMGYVRGVAPLDDDERIFKAAMDAERGIRGATHDGLTDPGKVVKGLSTDFASQFGMFLMQTPQNAALQGFMNEVQQILSTELGKNITLTSPLTSGLVPYDLVAPSRLIYPVYSPLRNKFPRPQGQGTSRRVKLFTAIAGSQTGQAVRRVSIPELQSGGSLASSNWPMNLPPSGAETAVDMTIPYKFFGDTKSLSWLAQFAGQGFEDVSALANLLLLQEGMMLEEYQMLAGTGTAISAPGAPTTAARTAGSGETTLSGVTTNVYVLVTATTYYGETAAGAVATQAWSAGQVIDVTIAPVRGALQYNIYTATGTAAPASTAFRLQVANVGATRYTLQGALSTVTAPPTADTGTSSTNDYEGMVSVLDGHAVTDATVYPAGFTGGYVNKSVNGVLSNSVLATALQAVWDGAASGNSSGGFRADPSELIAEGSDVQRLAADLLTNSGQSAAFRILIPDGPSQAGVRVGAAVSELQNPITRSVVRVLVHPWLTQGTAFGMSYTLPATWTNVSNVWENVMVQDYLSVSWPVIDASFRYSLFWFGALVCYAPQYNFILQGLQQSAATPYS